MLPASCFGSLGSAGDAGALSAGGSVPAAPRGKADWEIDAEERV